MLRFAIDSWAAWAPGLEDRAAWSIWLKTPGPLVDNERSSPPLREIPAVLRRRANRDGRAALQATLWADPAQGPIIFASRYGEIIRSVELLEQLAAHETLSPTTFSLSVHNAVGALFSIARSHKSNYTAISAGDETVEAAFTEALGLLADSAPVVTVVYYESPLPEIYSAFDEPNSIVRAWACRLKLSHGSGFELRRVNSDAPAIPSRDFPFDLEILRFLVNSDSASICHPSGARTWEWSRYACDD